MIKFPAILTVCLLCLSAAVFAEEAQDKEHDFVRELTYRQREYQSQQSYLSDKEARIAQELNSDISLQNSEPNAATLQRIDNLKARILEYLQDQIKNDRDYISYLEMRISELVDYKFPTLKAAQGLDADQGVPVKASEPPDAADAGEPARGADAPPVAIGDHPLSIQPQAADTEKAAVREYKRERIPISTSE